MEYVGVKVFAEGETLDLVCDAMWSIGAEGVSLSDGTEFSDAGRWDYADDSVRESKPTYAEFFVQKTDCDVKKTELLRYLSENFNIHIDEKDVVVSAPFCNEDWFNNWKKFYTEQQAGKFSIVPVWQTPKNPSSPYNILIDPGMAFGTGEHASTRLALTLLSDLDLHGKDVVDIGTGSGILGIAAAKCDAKSVYMCDIDGDAVKSASENVDLNTVADKVVFEVADLMSNVGDKAADVVLANLTADLLEMLLPAAVAIMVRGAYAVTSGIITPRLDEVVSIFAERGLRVVKILNEGDWNSVLFVKE